MPVNQILAKAQTRISENLEHTRREKSANRTGRASLAILAGDLV